MSAPPSPEAEPDNLLERLAGRGDSGRAPHPMRQAILDEAAIVAKAERLAREPLTDGERALMDRVRHRLQESNVLAEPQERPKQAPRDSKQRETKSGRRGRLGLAGLTLVSPRWLLVGGVGTLAFLWWLAQTPQPGQPAGSEIHLRGQADVTLIDPDPAARAKSVAQELQRLGWRATAVQANEQLWWVSIPRRDDASEAQLEAAAKSLNLMPSTPMPDRVRVQP